MARPRASWVVVAAMVAGVALCLGVFLGLPLLLYVLNSGPVAAVLSPCGGDGWWLDVASGATTEARPKGCCLLPAQYTGDMR